MEEREERKAEKAKAGTEAERVVERGGQEDRAAETDSETGTRRGKRRMRVEGEQEMQRETEA